MVRFDQEIRVNGHTTELQQNIHQAVPDETYYLFRFDPPCDALSIVFMFFQRNSQSSED